MVLEKIDKHVFLKSALIHHTAVRDVAGFSTHHHSQERKQTQGSGSVAEA